MAKRNSMRDGPLAQLFKPTETGQAPRWTRADQPPTRGRRREAPRPQLVDLADRESGAARFRAPDGQPYLAVIRVVGVGGGGCNAINRMIEAGVKRRRVHRASTPTSSSCRCRDAPTKIHIGREQTQGLGSGADPEVGRRGRRGLLRPHQDRAARLRHGVRDRRRGWRHRLRRGARGRPHRPRGGGAHGRHRHLAVRASRAAAAAAQAGGGRGGAARRRRHRDRDPQRPPAARCWRRAPRWSTPSGSPTTCCARACRASAT